jgi:uncharacterized integral membrane protein (TIGR00698 family)
MKLSPKPGQGISPLDAGTADWKIQAVSLLPGLMLTGILAALALALGHGVALDTLNPLLIAVGLGIGWRQWLPLPSTYGPGIKFAMKRILRLAVILLGLRLSLTDVVAVGPGGLLLVTLGTISTFYLTCWLGRWLGVPQRLVQLIAAGTAICGASAVVATNTVIHSSEEDMTYAIAMITGFGTLAMVTYPLVGPLLQLSPQAFGLWCGASVHEVAQVIATAFQQGPVSGEVATIVKLSRVLLVVPILIGLGWQTQRLTPGEQRPRSLPIPWFVVFFLALVIINSLNWVAAPLKGGLLQINQLLLCMALVAMGLETKLAHLTHLGWKPLYLAGASWLFLSAITLGMIYVMP